MIRRIKTGIKSFLPALRSKQYRFYLAGSGISLVGSFLASTSEQWLVYPILTNNPALPGIISFINLAPATLLMLVGGVVADRWDRKETYRRVQYAYMIIAGSLSLLVATGHISVWFVGVAAVASGIVFAFEQPTRQSFIGMLVTREQLPSALSLNQALFNTARAIGPAIAGVLIATVGIALSYGLNALSFIGVLFCLFMMGSVKTHTFSTSSGIRSGIFSGFQFLVKRKILAVLITLVFFITLSTWPIATLLPAIAHDLFHVGPIGFGLLQAFFGVGAAAGGLLSAKLLEWNKDTYKLLMTTVTGIVVGLIGTSMSQMFELTLLFQLISGFFVASTLGMTNTLVQLQLPLEMRGRVMSFYSTALIGGMPFGALLGSIGVTSLGVRETIFGCALFLATSTSLLILLTRGKVQSKLQSLI